MQLSIQNKKKIQSHLLRIGGSGGLVGKRNGSPTERSFFANIQVNPKELCKAIITRSEREVGMSDKRKIGDESEIIVKEEKNKGKEEKNRENEEEKKKEEERRDDFRAPLVKNLPYPYAPSRKIIF